MALTALPPLGAIGMASPLFAAAPAFPGFGLAGILLTATGLTALATGPRRLLLPAVPLLALLSLVAHVYAPARPRPPAQIHAISTRLGRSPTDLSSWLNRNLALRTLVRHTLHSTPSGSTLLFPEDAAGPWTRWSSVFWRTTAALARARGDTVLLGATLADPHGGLLDALIGFGAHRVVTSARQPIPLGSWIPAGRRSYRADWSRFGPTTIAGRRVAVLVCYEQLLIWPAAWAFLSPHPPGLIIAVSNHGWATPGIREPQIQANAATALARLFGVPEVSAANGPRPIADAGSRKASDLHPEQ
ncbi:MAG: hypothetical protein B7Z66_15365 [Chromatiales bacterium 21-64-14]|nr:MAG: hypothetical protein B7Z66_15365 [Chromatiales bacterium 21-64-14]